VSFVVLAPGGQSGNFWIHPRISHTLCSVVKNLRTLSIYVFITVLKNWKTGIENSNPDRGVDFAMGDTPFRRVLSKV